MQGLPWSQRPRRGADAEILGQSRDRANDGAGIATGGQIAGERTVNLDLIEREAPEVAQTGITGSEIIQGDADAEGTELVQCRLGSVAHFEEDRFSVISSSSRSGDSGPAANAPSTDLISPRLLNWTGERFTATFSAAGQRAVWA